MKGFSANSTWVCFFSCNCRSGGPASVWLTNLLQATLIHCFYPE